MTILTRQRVILAKTEATYKVDQTLTVADVIVCREPEITPLEGDEVSREIAQPWPGRSAGAPNFLANTRAMVTIPVELVSSGTAGTAPAWGTLMKACWMTETVDAGTSVTYTPASGDQGSVSIWINVGGQGQVVQKLSGCRGTFSLTFDQNAVPIINFTFTGDFEPPAKDTTNLASLTLNPGGVAKVYGDGNTEVKWGTQSSPATVCAGAIELDLANQVLFRSLPGCEESLITQRLPTGSLELEPTADTAQGLFNKSEATNFQELQVIQTNGGAGNIITITAPACQVMAPSWTDRDGVTFVTLPLELSPKAGDDELEIKLT